MRLTLRPLSPDLWPAPEELFGQNGACNGVPDACNGGMVSAYRKTSRETNKRAFQQAVENGPLPGLVAFDGDLDVGWCPLTPREALPWLDRTWKFKRIDDEQVWSLSCLCVRKGFRRGGITSALITEALRVAKRADAPALQAGPFDAGGSSSATGYASTFARARFQIVARRTAARPIMRHDLKTIQIKTQRS